MAAFTLSTLSHKRFKELPPHPLVDIKRKPFQLVPFFGRVFKKVSFNWKMILCAKLKVIIINSFSFAEAREREAESFCLSFCIVKECNYFLSIMMISGCKFSVSLRPLYLYSSDLNLTCVTVFCSLTQMTCQWQKTNFQSIQVAYS